MRVRDSIFNDCSDQSHLKLRLRRGNGPAPACCKHSLPVHTSMTRYTNVGRKRTYVQASFDPGDDQITSNLASTSALNSLDTSRTTHETSIDAAPEPSRKRSRKSKDRSGEKQTAESVSAVVISAGDKKNPPVTKSERAKKALAKLKAKEKAKRAKSACVSIFLNRL